MEESASPELCPLDLVEVKLEVSDPTIEYSSSLGSSDTALCLKVIKTSVAKSDIADDPLHKKDEENTGIGSPVEDALPAKRAVTLYRKLSSRALTNQHSVSGHGDNKSLRINKHLKKIKKKQKNVNLNVIVENIKKSKVAPQTSLSVASQATGTASFPCQLCSKVFTSNNAINGHMALHLRCKSKKPRMCEICGKICAPNRAAFRMHMSTHSTDKSFVCYICKTAFPTKYKLGCHVRRHTDKREFACDVCTKTFKVKSSLTNHKWRMHNPKRKEVQHTCGDCGKSFSTKSILTDHSMTHTNVEFQCDICLQMFSQQRYVTRHKKVVHAQLLGYPAPEKTEHQCDLCPKKFAFATSITRHKIEVHLRVRYQCDICLKWYAQKSAVKKHKERMHNGVRERKKRESRTGARSSQKAEGHSSEASD